MPPRLHLLSKIRVSGAVSDGFRKDAVLAYKKSLSLDMDSVCLMVGEVGERFEGWDHRKFLLEGRNQNVNYWAMASYHIVLLFVTMAP